MKKIIEFEKLIEINYYITTDEEVYPLYRRSEHGSWENQMGESWESVNGVHEIELEQLFQMEVSK
jgi:hypothetical protein